MAETLTVAFLVSSPFSVIYWQRRTKNIFETGVHLISLPNPATLHETSFILI